MRVLVMHGELLVGMGDDGPPLARPVTGVDGSAVSRDVYRGPGEVQGGTLFIGDASNPGAMLHEYRLGPITQSSRDYRAGWLHGMAQQRARAGATWGERFRDGWADAWREKRGA